VQATPRVYSQCQGLKVALPKGPKTLGSSPSLPQTEADQAIEVQWLEILDGGRCPNFQSQL
jgi:hypothetical protein